MKIRFCILVKNFFFYVCISLNTFTDPCPTAASAATCVLCNFTYKLSISTDMIIEIQITKLLKTSYRESLALDIFEVKICDTFKSYQLFDKINFQNQKQEDFVLGIR